MKKISFFLFGSILFLASCGPKITETQQEQLTLLTERVDSITTAINAIDSLSMAKMTQDFFERKEFIANDIKDTISTDIIFTLDAFIQLRKGMNFIQTEFQVIKREANIMNKQINDLNHDVEKRLIEEKQFEEYFKLEKNNSEQLKEASERLFFVVGNMTKEYPKMLPVIDSIIGSYKSKMNE